MTETRTMNFQTNNGDKLKDAIESLSYSNSKGDGIMEIDSQNGFKIITLDDSKTNVISFMHLEPNNLIDFSCTRPLKNKLVNLKFLLKMTQVFQKQSIVFFQEDDSSHFSFESPSDPGIILGVGMRECDAKFEAISVTTSPTWETILSTEELKTMIPEMIKTGYTQIVTVDRTSAETKFVIGEMEWKFKSNAEVGKSESAEAGPRHHIEFQCSCVDSLKKASSLAAQCSFALLPSGDVTFQFRFEEGSLVFIMCPVVYTTTLLTEFKTLRIR